MLRLQWEIPNALGWWLFLICHMPLQKPQPNASHSEYFLGTGSPLGSVCCVYPVPVRLSCKGEPHAGLIARPRKKGMPQNPLFWCSMSLLSWGWTQLTSRQVTELLLTKTQALAHVFSVNCGFRFSLCFCIQQNWVFVQTEHLFKYLAVSDSLKRLRLPTHKELLSWALY